MQSGITVSQELQDAFSTLTSSPSQRGLIASIQNEQIRLKHNLPSSSPDFFSDLPSLPPLLSTNEAAYASFHRVTRILLRRYQNAPDGYVAVTYIPDAAPVRQKMLFASTRLTLVRELGTERFRESLFVTELKELEKEGWEKHDASGALKAPLTAEEQSLEGLKEAEAEERGGTAGRKLETGGHLSINMSQKARQGFESFRDGDENLLQLVRPDSFLMKELILGSANIDQKFDNKEMIELAESGSTDVGSLATAISATEPRFTFFKYKHSLEGAEQEPVVFIYTCPSESKIKERMVYAATKLGFLSGVKHEFGIEAAKKLEASSPSEITAAALEEEFRPKQEQKQAFSKPKKPGRR